MTDLEQAVKHISNKTGIDSQEVKNIIQYAFKFTIDVMTDEKDTHDILFNKLFKFKLKSRFKENKNKNYSPKL